MNTIPIAIVNGNDACEVVNANGPGRVSAAPNTLHA